MFSVCTDAMSTPGLPAKAPRALPGAPLPPELPAGTGLVPGLLTLALRAPLDARRRSQAPPAAQEPLLGVCARKLQSATWWRCSHVISACAGPALARFTLTQAAVARPCSSQAQVDHQKGTVWPQPLSRIGLILLEKHML